MKVKTKNTKRISVEGSGLSIGEFHKEIKKGEKGPFFSPEESKNVIASWRKKKGSR